MDHCGQARIREALSGVLDHTGKEASRGIVRPLLDSGHADTRCAEAHGRFSGTTETWPRFPMLPPCDVTRRDALRRRVTFRGECSRGRTSAAPPVHEVPAEVEIGLVLVVRRAAKLDVVRVVTTALRKRMLVVKLDATGGFAATPAAVHVPAPAAVALPHGPPQRRGNGSGFRLLSLWRRVACGPRRNVPGSRLRSPW
jgi:hypothetical protein